MRCRGFTLIELLVVLAMIMILAGAMTASVNAARRRARISKAQQEMKELTNAILAFEQYAPGRTLEGQFDQTDLPTTSRKLADHLCFAHKAAFPLKSRGLL